MGKKYYDEGSGRDPRYDQRRYRENGEYSEEYYQEEGYDQDYYQPVGQYDQNGQYYDEQYQDGYEDYADGYEDQQYYDEQSENGVPGNKKRRKAMKIVAVVVAALLIIVGGMAVYGYYYIQNIRANPLEAFTDVNPDNQIQLEEESTFVVSEKTNEKLVTFALIGLDSSAEREAKNMGWRSDTMVVCVVNTEKKSATMITLPRDTKTKVNKIDDSGKVTSTITAKLNAAFTYGGGPKKYGYANAAYAMSRVLFLSELGIPDIKLTAGLNIDGITVLADKLGGVPVKLEKDYPGVGKKGDTVELKGKAAEDFVRTRKGSGLTGSDEDRAVHQQWFIKGIARKVKSMGAASAITKIYSELSNTIQTNMDTGQMASLAVILDAMDVDTMETIMLPGKAVHESKAWYYIQDEEATKEMVKQVFYKN